MMMAGIGKEEMTTIHRMSSNTNHLQTQNDFQAKYQTNHQPHHHHHHHQLKDKVEHDHVRHRADQKISNHLLFHHPLKRIIQR